MTTRATTLKVGAFTGGGATRVTSLKVGAFANSPAPVRVSTLKVGAFVSEHTNGLRVTTLRLAAWVDLSTQGLYLTFPPFGSHEVFTPSISATFMPETPAAPDIEVNPYRTDVPNVDQQRIMREQHNITQAGDSTFHWGVLTEISPTPLYNLGSVGRFYHDEFGIAIARYVKFTSYVETAAKAVPVGLNRRLNQPWVVTNQLELSDADSVMGIACPYNELIYSGSWFGWVIVDGFVPAELDISLDNSSFAWAVEYGWSETGKVKPGVAGASLGTRFTTSKVPNLKPGEFLVKVNPLSQAKLSGLITTKLDPLTTQVVGLTTAVNVLAAKVDSHTQQIGQLQSQVVGLDNRITSESAATARQLAAIRALMPDTDFKSYVDGQVAQLVVKIDTQDSIISQIANNALAKVNELGLRFDSLSTVALQNQIDALNNSLGGLTSRLVGFEPIIDTTTLTAGQVLISTDAGFTPGGTQLYTFNPIDFKMSSLVDVDVSSPPNNGDALIWDNTASLYKPGPVSGGGGGGGGTQFVCVPEMTFEAGATFNYGFFGGRAIVIPCDCDIEAVAFVAKAASAGKCTPAIYAYNSPGLGALLADGPQSSATTIGLNELPLTTPYTVTAGTLLWIGLVLQTANLDFADCGTSPRVAFFAHGTATPPNPAPATSFGAAGWGNMHLKIST